MNCDDANDLMVDSLLDGLDPDESTRLEAHLESCETCRRSAEQVRRMWDELGELAAPRLHPATSVEFGRRLERQRHRWMSSGAMRAASVVLLLFTGFLLGRLVTPSGETAIGVGGSEFLLLIRGNAPEQSVPEAQLVQEYGAWADRLAESGRLVTARKLTDDQGRWLNATPRPSAEPARTAVGGFFIVRASNYEEAELIARESPHVSYGGIIEVRAIDLPASR